MKDRVHLRQVGSHNPCEKSAQHHLALHAHIVDVSLEGDGDGQSRENQRRGVVQGVHKSFGGKQRLSDENSVGLQGILPQGQNNDSSQHKG